ncbi:sulfite oxidase-like oxidoreductase [Sphingomonas sp. R86521]|uniref:sulfite oxidase-like oxidoreductase n=1 Tax=Sphingomonas sp. R86521 TaxID=3093860 RepID=UPI0036D41CD8
MNNEIDPSKNKLTRSKIARAKAHHTTVATPDLWSVERLPPGQHLTEKWPVLDLGIVPEIAPRDWTLSIDGIVGGPVVLAWHDFLDLPQVELRSDIHCVTAWSRYDNEWAGIATSTLVVEFPPLPDRAHVVLTSHDGYTTNLTLADFSNSGALLAHSWSGELLAREHGGPVRVVVPHLYLWKSAKWLRRISYVSSDEPGFWETRGYHNRGDPWREERYS